MKNKTCLIQIEQNNLYKLIDKGDEKNNLGYSYLLKLPDDNILFVCNDPKMLKEKLDT